MFFHLTTAFLFLLCLYLALRPPRIVKTHRYVSESARVTLLEQDCIGYLCRIDELEEALADLETELKRLKAELWLDRKRLYDIQRLMPTDQVTMPKVNNE